jgi:hypothetical protein
MNRTKLLGIVICAMAPFAGAQQSNPQTPEDALTTRELIAWSQLQKPQPAPQPLPPPETIPQPEQPRDQQSKTPADPHLQQEPAQWVTGKIVRDGGRFLLQLAGNRNSSYRLEGEVNLGKYESRNVRIFGPLNLELMTIHAISVELLS